MISIAFRGILSVLTLLYSLVAMGSCAARQPEQQVSLTQPGVPQEQQGATLTILSARPEISRALQEAADLYLVGKDDDISIRVQTIGSESSYRATLRARMLAEEQVDLFHIFGRQDILELEGRLEDLSAIPWVEDAIPFTLEPVRVGQSLYGVPYSVDAVGLIANRDIFEAAELPLGGLVTSDDMEETFKTLREKITLGEMKESFPELEAVTELPGQDNAFAGGQLADIALGGEFSTAAQAATAKAVLLEDNAAVGEYVDLLARYATNGKGWPRLAKTPQGRQVEEGILAGRVAIIQQSVSVLTRALGTGSEPEPRLRLLPIPLRAKENGEDESFIYAEVPAYWAINAAATEQSKAVARDFLTWLYQSETGATLYAGRFGAVSPYRETAVDTGVTLHSQMLGYIEQGRFLPRRYREFPADFAVRGFAEAMRDYFTDLDLSWAEAMERVKNEWSAGRKSR